MFFGFDRCIPEVEAAVCVVGAGFEAVVGGVAKLVEGGPECLVDVLKGCDPCRSCVELT